MFQKMLYIAYWLKIWDKNGNGIQTNGTKNDEYYANLLQRLSDEIKKKRPHLVKKKMSFHQDNAPIHTSVIAMAKINKLMFKLLNFDQKTRRMTIAQEMLNNVNGDPDLL